MGFTAAPVCRAPLWAAPPPHWFAPHHTTVTNMTEAVEFKPPNSPQSDTDSSHSSTSDCHTEGYYRISATPNHKTVEVEEVPRCGWKDCGQTFSTLDGLSSHVAAAHAVVHNGMFYCQWTDCPRGHRGFNARYKMLVHVRTHTNERPHKCCQCNKSFSRAENLKIHTRSHSGEKPYVCPVEGCNKAYSNSSDRFKHTRTHSVDKPYYCKIPGCQKRYTDPSSLRKHVKTYKHTNIVSENDVQNKDAMINEPPQHPAMRSQLNHIRNYDNTLRTEVNSSVDVSGIQTYENESKVFQKRYSFSDDSKSYGIDLKTNQLSYEIRKLENDSMNDLCFCKDLPCIHTSRYVTPEFDVEDIDMSETKSNKYYKVESTIDEEVLLNGQTLHEPLDLQRHRYIIYDNLEKNGKTEIIFENGIDSAADVPLDLSNKRYF